MAIETPWTAIIFLNEEFFIAKEEELKMRDNAPKHALPRLTITRLKGRKYQFPRRRDWTCFPCESYERFREGDLKFLEIKYDKDAFPDVDFDIQTQAERDKQRGLDSVFIDELELLMDVHEGKAPYLVGFTLTVVPKNSETHREIRATVRTYSRNYGLYEGMPRKEFRKKFLEMPSCLEVSHIYSGFPEGPIRPVDVTNTYLNGRTERSKDFLMDLFLKTNGLIQCAYKVPSVEEGMILDGIVREFPRR
jgi:hypothetical protein